jgi:exosortase family protein XrtF
VLLGLWYFVYTFFIKPSFIYDALIIDKLSRGAHFVLKLFGVDSILIDGRFEGCANLIQLPGSAGVQIGPECDGLIVISLFVFFVLVFPGPWKSKIWYIPSGTVLLFLLNIIRISVLAYMVKESPEWLSFNHDYTFTIIIYAFVFLLWYVWVNKLSQ